MDKKEIRRNWLGLIIPFTIGSLLLLFGLARYFMSGNSTTVLRSFFICLFGATLVFFSGKKILLFRKYLRDHGLDRRVP